jgi:hypothetical protein
MHDGTLVNSIFPQAAAQMQTFFQHVLYQSMQIFNASSMVMFKFEMNENWGCYSTNTENQPQIINFRRIWKKIRSAP